MSHWRASLSSVTKSLEFALSISAGGEPMFATINLLFRYAAGGNTLAGFGAVNVIVRSAWTASPIGFAQSALSPEGRSTEIIRGRRVDDLSRACRVIFRC